MLRFPVDLGDGAELVLVDEQDAAEIFAVVDRDRARLRAWLPWVDAAKDASFNAAYLRDARLRRERGVGIECGIRVAGRLVGGVGLHHVDLVHRSGEIGYWVAGDHEGRGLVTRAVAALVARAFADGLHRLEIRLWPENPRSRAVAERLDFIQEGLFRAAGWHPDGWRDLEVWAKLAP